MAPEDNMCENPDIFFKEVFMMSRIPNTNSPRDQFDRGVLSRIESHD